MKVKRAVRVSEMIKREVSELISTKLKDPGVKTVNITYVKVSDDLRHARIYYRIIGNEKAEKEVQTGLDRANKFIRSEIGQRAQLRHVPELKFFFDHGSEYADHIDQLLLKIKKEEQ